MKRSNLIFMQSCDAKGSTPRMKKMVRDYRLRQFLETWKPREWDKLVSSLSRYERERFLTKFVQGRFCCTGSFPRFLDNRPEFNLAILEDYKRRWPGEKPDTKMIKREKQLRGEVERRFHAA